jgi:oligosaccharide repeat unit polymerase
MSIFLLLLAYLFSVFVGKSMFGKWFNHVFLYSTVWGGTLILFELKLINYYPLESETWIIILTTWILFLLGSITIGVARNSLKSDSLILNDKVEPIVKENELLQLRTILIWLNIITLFAGIYDLYLVSKIFGSLTNAFLFGNLLYSYQVSEGLPGSIPFFSSLSFTAAMLAGSYTAQKGKITFISIFPLMIITLIGLVKMGRVDILMGTILFISGYFLTSKRKEQHLKKSTLVMRKFTIIFIVIIIAVAGAEFIRNTRKVHEGFKGTTKTLSSSNIISPSVYLYLSSHHGTFNQYLKHGGENTPFGANTFLPIYRWLGKLGLEIHIKSFQYFYKTPVRTNTGTYLRELHADFGMIGLLLGPYILGLLASMYWYRIKKYGRFVDISIAAFLYVIIGMSFFVMATRQGQLIVYLVTAIIIGHFIDKRMNRFSGAS